MSGGKNFAATETFAATSLRMEKYSFHQIVGKGNFGDVYRGTHRALGRTVAIKVVDLDGIEDDINELLREVQFLREMQLPYITRYIETFLADTRMFIVMEYCGGSLCGDLLKCHKHFNEQLIKYIVYHVLMGLLYVHQSGKVHRDVKLGNIFLTSDGLIKLGDFGVSGELTRTCCKRHTFVGTPLWMAPEVIVRKLLGGYNEKADIWLLGITIIEFATGRPPLLCRDPLKVVFNIPSRAPPKLEGSGWSPEMVDFVRLALEKDPSDRPSAKKLLQHGWFQMDLKKSWAATQRTLKELIVQSQERKSRRAGRTPPVPRYLKHFAGTQVMVPTQVQVNHIDWDVDPTAPAQKFVTNGERNEEEAPGGKEADYEDNSSEYGPHCHRGDILFYCLEQVSERASSEATAGTVVKLITNLREYEESQPGLCDAIIEEVFGMYDQITPEQPF